MFYRVRLSKDDNGSVLATFPDVPEAVSFGDTEADALEHALDALLSVFDSRMRAKEPIPAPAKVVGGTGVRVPTLEALKLEVYQAMRSLKLSKAELGRRLHVPPPMVDRILNVRHTSQFDQVEGALLAMGKHLVVHVEDLPVTPARRGRARASRAGRSGRRPAASAKR